MFKKNSIAFHHFLSFFPDKKAYRPIKNFFFFLVRDTRKVPEVLTEAKRGEFPRGTEEWAPFSEKESRGSDPKEQGEKGGTFETFPSSRGTVPGGHALISREKMYDMILNTKRHEEIRRDEINKYYTSLFTGVVSLIPILDKVLDSHEKSQISSWFHFKTFLIFVSCMGVGITISWMLTLVRLYYFLQGTDVLLSKLEKGAPFPFVSYMNHYLSKKYAPSRVTKQALMVPIMFLIIFLATLLYSMG